MSRRGARPTRNEARSEPSRGMIAPWPAVAALLALLVAGGCSAHPTYVPSRYNCATWKKWILLTGLDC